MFAHRSLLLLVTIVAFLRYANARCSYDQIECRDGSRCIYLYQVCVPNNGQQCNDGSDEDPQICEFWKPDKSRCGSSSGTFYRTSGYSSACYTAQKVCDIMPDSIDERICKIVASGKLVYDPPLPPEEPGMRITGEIMSNLSTAVNTSLKSDNHQCPMLYIPVGHLCIAFFSPAKVHWAEARQFCQSIYGDLLSFTDVGTYGMVLKYMKEALLTSNFWLGGRYDMDTNSWAWVHDDSPMPLGSPYWSQKYSASCVPRGPPAPLPGASCYLQAPSQREIGWCSAMTYENFYYISDEECVATHSPLCLLSRLD